MSGEIVKKSEATTAIEAIRNLMALTPDEQLAIAKSGIADGTWGLARRGLSVLQRWNEQRFIPAFLDELEEMRTAGQIREDLHQTDAGVASVREFFEFVDGKPDEERFHAFCALFMNANAPDVNEKEVLVDLELMKSLQSLTAGEMHLLSAVLKVQKYKVSGPDLNEELAKHLGYRVDTLVKKQVSRLISEGFVDEENWQRRGGTGGTEKVLITDYARALIRRIEKYNNFKATLTSKEGKC